VRSVEDRLAAPLFARTTRSVSLTEAGARFVAGIEPALADIGKAVEGLTAERGQVTGLRINAPQVVLEMLLTRILAKLARQHSRLTVEVRTGQESVDIVTRGFDAGIGLRRAIQQDMVTTRLTGPLWLLPQTTFEHDGLYLYYPRRASLAPKLRAFIDVAKKTLKSFE
jgi:DNA-binding transcriptional LysR family regulator